MVDPNWKWHVLTVRRLRESLAHLEPTDLVAATDIGTLAIVRGEEYAGFVDTWGGGSGIVPFADRLPAVEYEETDLEPDADARWDRAMGVGNE